MELFLVEVDRAKIYLRKNEFAGERVKRQEIGNALFIFSLPTVP
jgi:hypothetical protein